MTAPRLETLGWAALTLLLALTFARAIAAPRDRWAGLVGDEATYLMQAESIAFDFDLRFAAEDLERFQQRRGYSPEVILHSGDGGARITYGKPFFYAAAIAPFVRVWGERGALLANAIVLAAAGLLSALALVRRGSATGPWWIAAVLFGSVAFGHVYWIHPDLFLMSAAACGLALGHLLRSRAAAGGFASPRRRALSWSIAGALLAIPGCWRPPYLLLLLPGALLAAGGRAASEGDGAGVDPGANPRDARARSLVSFAVGASLLAAIAVCGQELASGSWSPYAGERRGFSELEGFPGVDYPAGEWSQRVQAKGNTSWLGEGTLEASASPSLVGWNLLYLFFGRTVGLVPYFLPAIAALVRRRPRVATLLEMGVGVGVALSFMLITPFNFYGGAGAVANRYFLPAFPLFWFAGAGAARCLATTILAAPFLLPLWLAPAAHPILPGEGYRYVSAAAHRLLPVETTQRHVKAPGRADVLVGDLWVRFLDGGLAPAPPGSGDLVLVAGRRAEILIGRASPITGIALDCVGDDPIPVRAEGPGPTEPDSPSSEVVVRFERATARHPMWWSSDPFWLYRVGIEAAGSPAHESVALRLRAIADRPHRP